MEGYLQTLKKIFDMFDVDSKNSYLTAYIENKTVSHKEMINCMLLMCGGTF